MQLKRLLKGIGVLETFGRVEGVDISALSRDSRDTKKGGLFVACRGVCGDGHHHLPAVIRQKAGAVVFSDRRFAPSRPYTTPFILVRDSKTVLSRIAGCFYGCPYRRVRSVGITGTNGKTTTSYLIRSVLEACGRPSGLIGTLGCRIGAKNTPVKNTTPGVLELHEFFKKMLERGIRHAVMEVSSHALEQGRLEGMIFGAAVFTNLTRDHLDYHKTMDSYYQAKKKLFSVYADDRTCFIVNRDDVFGLKLLSTLKGRRRPLSYGFSPEADVYISDFEIGRNGSRAALETPLGGLAIATSLVGRHNLYNILAAAAFGVSQKFKLSLIKKGIEKLKSVPGRLERIDARKGFSVFVDYAHTDDALKNVLESLRAIVHNGRIITVFGCGGGRDKGKRPKMGQVAESLSDYCVVTSDNPRGEGPSDIITGVVSGMKKNFEVEPDRYQALKKALNLAGKGDFVLVAGKGHETYQVIGDKALPFDDRAVVKELLMQMK